MTMHTSRIRSSIQSIRKPRSPRRRPWTVSDAEAARREDDEPVRGPAEVQPGNLPFQARKPVWRTPRLSAAGGSSGNLRRASGRKSPSRDQIGSSCSAQIAADQQVREPETARPLHRALDPLVDALPRPSVKEERRAESARRRRARIPARRPGQESRTNGRRQRDVVRVSNDWRWRPHPALGPEPGDPDGLCRRRSSLAPGTAPGGIRGRRPGRTSH